MSDSCIHSVALDEICVLCERTNARLARNERDIYKRDLAALRQRHAEAYEVAFKVCAWAVCTATDLDCDVTKQVVDDAWLASSAKAALEGKP